MNFQQERRASDVRQANRIRRNLKEAESRLFQAIEMVNAILAEDDDEFDWSAVTRQIDGAQEYLSISDDLVANSIEHNLQLFKRAMEQAKEADHGC